MTDNDRLAHCNRMTRKYMDLQMEYFDKHARKIENGLPYPQNLIVTGKHMHRLLKLQAKQDEWQDKAMALVQKEIFWSGWTN
jgi:hypothetical protein